MHWTEPILIAATAALTALIAAAATGLIWVGWIAPTGSMEPTLTGGHLIITTPRTPTIGDIAVVHRSHPYSPIVHRVIDQRPDGSVLLQGDAIPWPDPHWDQPDAIIGTVRVAIPHLGRPLLWLSERRDGGGHPRAGATMSAPKLRGSDVCLESLLPPAEYR